MGMLSRFVAGAGEGLADVGKQMLRTADSGLLIEQQAKIQQERDFRLEEYKTGEREAGERFLSKEKGLDRADQAPLRSAQARLYGSQAGEAEQKTVDRKRLSELQDQFLALSPEQRAGDEGKSLKEKIELFNKVKGVSGEKETALEREVRAISGYFGVSEAEAYDIRKYSSENPTALAIKLAAERDAAIIKHSGSITDEQRKKNIKTSLEDVEKISQFGFTGVGARKLERKKGKSESAQGFKTGTGLLFGGRSSNGIGLGPDLEAAVREDISTENTPSAPPQEFPEAQSPGILSDAQSKEPPAQSSALTTDEETPKESTFPPLPRNPEKRQVGRKYVTPSGRVIVWTEQGGLPVK